MPQNGFSVGRDYSLDIITQNGPLSFGLIISFSSKQDSTEKKIKGLDGITRPVRFFDGWSGNIEVTRQDDTLDAYFAQLEEDYYNGLTEQGCTITETITEVDGSVSQYRYLGVLLKYDSAGNKSGDDTISQALSFMASRRKKVS